MNHAFATDVSFLFENTDLWVFGHTHYSCDIKFGETTRIFSNQLGYEG